MLDLIVHDGGEPHPQADAGIINVLDVRYIVSQNVKGPVCIGAIRGVHPRRGRDPAINVRTGC